MTEKDMIIQRLRRDNDALEEEIEKLKNPKGLTAEEKIDRVRAFCKWCGENIVYDDTLMTGESIIMAIVDSDGAASTFISGDGEAILAMCRWIANEMEKRRGEADDHPMS